MSRWTKRIKLWLAVGAVWMLLFSWIDLYWLVMPEIPPHLNQYETYDQVAAKYGDTSTHLADPVNWFMLVGIMGCVASFTIFRLREHPLLCRRDPRSPRAWRSRTCDREPNHVRRPRIPSPRPKPADAVR